MLLKKLVSLLSCFVSILNIAEGQYNLVCYYDSKAATYPTPILVSDLSSANCTHYIYIGLGLNQNGTIRVLRPDIDLKYNGFTNATTMLNQNGGQKVLIGLGGQYESSLTFSKATSTSTVSTLITNIALFIDKYKFDGIDIDWRYPTVRGGIASDKVNFASFLMKLRARLKMMQKTLSVSVSGNKAIYSTAYDIVDLSLYADMINVFSFNYTETNPESMTAYLAPLYVPITFNVLNANSSILEFLLLNVRRSKLNLGIPTFAKGYVLKSPTSTAVGALVAGLAPNGPNTNMPGYLAQYELCPLISSYTMMNDTVQSCSYYVNAKSWITSDISDSMVEKLSFVVNNRLAGAAIYTLDWDDFNNTCEQGNFPSTILAQQYLFDNFV